MHFPHRLPPFAILAILTILVIAAACSPKYSAYVYDRTADIKKQAIALCGKSEEPYDKYAEKVAALKIEAEALYKQEQLRKHNKTKQKQWALMLDPEGHLLYGYLEKWHQDTVLNDTFIDLSKRVLTESFELLQETEKNNLK